MKQLVVLDIDNCQKDYSAAMECIGLLSDKKIKEAGEHINSKLVGKFFRVPLHTSNTVTRYFECPQLKNGIVTDGKEINNITEIYSNYFNIFKDYTSRKAFGDKVNKDELKLSLISKENSVFNVQIPSVILSKLQHKDNVKRPQWIESVNKNEIYYHIRIRVANKSVYNLQYLALLLQKHNDLVNSKKLSVLLLSDENCMHYFPFGNINDTNTISKINEDHKTFSRYLRLLAKDNTGVIYAPYFETIKENGLYEPKILPMDFKNSSIGDNFFPLLEINSETYDLLFSNKQKRNESTLSSIIEKNALNNDNISVQTKYSLFQSGNLRFYDAGSQNPHDAFLPYIAETSWRKLRKNWVESNTLLDSESISRAKETIINRFTEEKNNWLTFAIFSFIFDSKKELSIATCIDQTYQISRELSKGIQQLMQNSIQHSEYKSCFFTFFLDENKNKLHLSIIDLNTQKTIIESFKVRLFNEINTFKTFQQQQNQYYKRFDALIESHRGLMESDDIALKHFFNIFDSNTSNQNYSTVQNLWKNFRKSDSTAHIGLLIFYQAILQCNADFMIQSSKDYEIDNIDKCRFIDLFKTRYSETSVTSSNYNFGKEDSSRIIPGTQYQIIVPTQITYFNNPVGEASISDTNLLENYCTFAKYIDYKPIPIKLLGLNKTINKLNTMFITNPEEKFKMQLIWTKFWDTNLNNLISNPIDNSVYYWHMEQEILSYLFENDNSEIFLKGLFGAFVSIVDIKTPIYIAIKNTHSIFMEKLREVCISLSGKNFCKNLQIYFVDDSYENNVQLLGNSFYEAVTNAIKLSIEHGSISFRAHDAVSVNHISNASNAEEPINEKTYPVMPFDVIIPESNNEKRTIFEARLLKLVEKNLDNADSHGYKLENTHMRLGNKVHIQSFYEMSFLFYRTTIANRIAFKIIKSYSPKLIDRIQITSNSCTIDPIIYYSYASYSKAILTSLVEITREYIELYIKKYLRDTQEKIDEIIAVARSQIAFASYQHNLQSEATCDHIQLYFGLQKDFSGAKLRNSTTKGGLCLELNHELKTNIAVVLVVPISSTLTTFDKMFSKLKERIHEDSERTSNLLKLSDCYTAFWVREEETKSLEHCIEHDYFDNVDEINQIITVKTNNKTQGGVELTELVDCPDINYFMQAKAVWNSPLLCQLCFPNKDELIREIPLVETDLTSTVPSQQIRCAKQVESNEKRNIRLNNRFKFNCGETPKHDSEDDSGDDSNDNKGNNYRLTLLRDCVYYGHIKRSKNHHQYYISTQDYFYKNEVQKEIREWLSKLRAKGTSTLPKLKIIFSPEHNTNVGFAQYVNTYYFNGTAEIISVNEDKVFRSNFICEHQMLKNTIERLHIQKNVFDDSFPVEFYFVDDSIITGATINKANSLLRSLLPERYISEYPAFLFKNCFILIDRLSNESKRTFVLSGNEADYYSFVHIDISNMRTQGDSCVGCKLQNEAKKMFKRSASRITANYWANKYQRLEPINYDTLEKMELFKNKTHAYERLILSHISQNYIFSDGIITREKGEYYDCILYLFENILNFSKKRKTSNDFFFDDLLYNLVSNLQSPEYSDPKLCISELLLKLLARPFFSFDYSFKLQIQSFVIIIAEYYLDYYSSDSQKIDWNDYAVKLTDSISEEDNYKSFLLRNDRIKKTIYIAECFRKLHKNDPILVTKFLKDIVFEALGDLRSTYLLRKPVIFRINKFIKNYLLELPSHNNNSSNCNCWSCAVCKKTSNKNKRPSESMESEDKNSAFNEVLTECKYLLDSAQCEEKTAVNCFFISYLANIQRILECGSDEIKSVWFEYLLLSGEEINNQTYNTLDEFNITDKNTQIAVQNIMPFNNRAFAVELFLTTAAIGFDIVEKKIPKTSETDHFLRNYYLSKKWINQNIKSSEEIKQWHSLLSTFDKKHDIEKTTVPQIDKRYENFLNNMVGYLSNINKLEPHIFNVALLTMAKKEDIASIEKIQLVKDWFGKNAITNLDIKQARYIIKDRVVNAFNNETIKFEKDISTVVGKLTENGYQMVLADSKISDETYIEQQVDIQYQEHHVAMNHRKPYLIIYFDNPDKIILSNDLGRKLVPLSRVFLYISMEITDSNKRDDLPWIILRDILAYRNRILRFLSEDFNGDIMEKHAVSVKEEAILTHERASSHASTTDEKGVLRVFGVENVSKLNKLTYPIDLKTKKILDGSDDTADNYCSSELWLLLQNYVNGQIARLFSRSFNRNEESLDDARDVAVGIPALYLSSENEQTDNLLKKRLVRFSDLKANKDNRFLLFQKAAKINFFINDECKLYHNSENKYYNEEYMRCIILDIFFSSIKYSTVDDSLLPRVDNLIYNKNCPEELKKTLECTIICYKDACDLVILNNVKRNRVKKDNILFHNEEIYRRTHDPLDYGDGHMSLLTIRSFILGIYKKSEFFNKKDTLFQYITKEQVNNRIWGKDFYDKVIDDVKKYDVWFETRLPIFLEED